MEILSINVGKEGTIQYGERRVSTGIHKLPTEHPVQVSRRGLEEDVISDAKHHGGPDQAVYIYGAVDYQWWEKELRREIPPGTFGENLTITGLESAGFGIGDQLQAGGVILQVTSPRIPCGVFAARMTDPQWVKKFRDAGRPGLYCRVMREGILKKGDPLSVERYPGKTLTILEMFQAHYQKEKTVDLYQRHLSAPIDMRTRKQMEEELHKLQIDRNDTRERDEPYDPDQ